MPAPTDTTTRMAPVQPPYEGEIATMLAKWMPPGQEAEPLRLFRVLAHNVELAGRMRPLGAGILGRSATVPPLLREIMIHRTCALNGNEYEWGVHATAFGRPLGFSDEQLRSTVSGSPADGCWEGDAQAVFALADELHAGSDISAGLWQSLRGRFGDEQVLELIATAGWYRLISYVCNGLRVEREEWALRFADVA
jgi:4-carboxymuconolactone decarboxylase